MKVKVRGVYMNGSKVSSRQYDFAIDESLEPAIDRIGVVWSRYSNDLDRIIITDVSKTKANDDLTEILWIAPQRGCYSAGAY